MAEFCDEDNGSSCRIKTTNANQLDSYKLQDF